MRSAPLSPSAKTAIRARRAAVRSCASAIAFASDGDGKGAKGASFFATALAIIFRKGAVLATSLLGLMFFLWVVLLHLPRVAASPHNGNEWTSAFVALAMSGSALALAGNSR